MVYDDRGKRVRGRCRYCGTVIRASNSSNYIHHMAGKHSDRVQLRSSPRKRSHSDMTLSGGESSTNASTSTVLTQSCLRFHSVSSSKIESFRLLTVQLFAEFSLPHHLLESELFQRFLMEFEQIKQPIGDKLLSRWNHRKLVISTGKFMFDEVINRLSSVVRSVVRNSSHWPLMAGPGLNSGRKIQIH